MKYLILLVYIALFSMIPEWMGWEFDVAIIGSFLQATGASRDARRFQREADSINPIRPTYQTPEEMNLYLQDAYNMAQGNIGGFGRMLGQAYGTTAETMGRARNLADSGTGMLQSLSQADFSQRRNIGDVNMQNVLFQQQGRGALQQALMNMAGQRDLEFDVNQMQPYLQQESDKRQFQQAAWQQKAASRDAWANFADGAVGIGMAAMGAPMGASGKSMFAKIFGGGGQQRTTTQPVKSPDRGIPSMSLNMPISGIYR